MDSSVDRSKRKTFAIAAVRSARPAIRNLRSSRRSPNSSEPKPRSAQKALEQHLRRLSRLGGGLRFASQIHDRNRAEVDEGGGRGRLEERPEIDQRSDGRLLGHEPHRHESGSSEGDQGDHRVRQIVDAAVERVGRGLDREDVGGGEREERHRPDHRPSLARHGRHPREDGSLDGPSDDERRAVQGQAERDRREPDPRPAATTPAISRLIR